MGISKINKRGDMTHQVIIHLVLIALIFAMFFMATVGRTNSRAVKQQVLERQIALLIDAAEPGMSISVFKINGNGVVGDVVLLGGKVFVRVDGLSSVKGYPYFSRYDVGVKIDVGEDGVGDDKFVVSVK